MTGQKQGSIWGVSKKVALSILRQTKNPELQQILVNQSKYQAQRLKDMRQMVQR